MSEQRPSRRFRRLQLMTTGLMVLMVAMNYIDRGAIAIANINIRHDFGLSATAVGGLISAWSFAYALGQLPAGFLVDRLGPRRMIGLAVLIWSLAQAAGGFALSFAQLAASRAGLGVAEAPGLLGCARVTKNWYHANERGLPSGAYIGATVLAPAFAPVLLTALMIYFNWRVMFITIGVLGIVMALAWYGFYRDTEDVALGAEDRAYAQANNPEPATTISFRQWLRLFKFQTTWGLTFGTFGLGYVFWIFFGWFPFYLESRYHVSIAHTGFLSGIPWLGGLAGAAFGGYLSDMLAKRHANPFIARKIPLIGGLFCMAVFTALIAVVDTVGLTLVCAFFVIFGGICCTTALWALVTVVAPQKYTASLASIPNCGAYLGATCSPIVTGFLVDRTGSFVPALLTGTAIGLISCTFYLLMIRAPVRVEDLEEGGTLLIAQPTPTGGI